MLGVLALPFILPSILGLVETRLGKPLVTGRLPIGAIYLTLVGNIVAWMLYGLSYWMLVGGVIGSAPGSIAQYIAVYAGAYVLGYLVFFLPAGIGAREVAQAITLTARSARDESAGGRHPRSSARLWLTMVLEILPGFFFFSRGTRPRHQELTERNGSKP